MYIMVLNCRDILACFLTVRHACLLGFTPVNGVTNFSIKVSVLRADENGDIKLVFLRCFCNKNVGPLTRPRCIIIDTEFFFSAKKGTETHV
jgi:hypothetical protein